VQAASLYDLTQSTVRALPSRVTHGEQDFAARDQGPTAKQGPPNLTRVSARTEVAPSHRDGRQTVMAVQTVMHGQQTVDGQQTVMSVAGEVSQGANLAAATSLFAPPPST